jgi:hypothetical protein
MKNYSRPNGDGPGFPLPDALIHLVETGDDLRQMGLFGDADVHPLRAGGEVGLQLHDQVLEGLIALVQMVAQQLGQTFIGEADRVFTRLV